jgi:hypothetical protein
MITNNEKDELIFDFLEGNMSPEEEEAFRILQEESELLSREVRLWRNTYLEEALPSVESLEKRLLIHSNGSSGNFLSRIYTCLIVLFTYLTISGDSVLKPISDTVVNSTAVSQNPVKNTNVIFDCIEKERDSKVASTFKNQQRTMTEKSEPVYQSVILSDLKPKSLVNPQKITLQKIEIKKTDVGRKSPSVTSRKKWSKREMRQIRQKLWKNNRDRKAAEFLKGKVPYVVPLNSNNF